MSEDKLKMRHAYFPCNLKTREDESSGDKYIEGYFIVFNQPTELWQGTFEQIASGAVDDSLNDGDIRCLLNHNPEIVLGRTASGTLELKKDSYGLYGKAKVNPDDRAACDAHARVFRGDISGASFGFITEKESYEIRDDGSIIWTEEKIRIHEVSVCTFPAYEQTEIEAREEQVKTIKKREAVAKRETLKKRLEEIKC